MAVITRVFLLAMLVSVMFEIANGTSINPYAKVVIFYFLYLTIPLIFARDEPVRDNNGG